MGNYNYNNYIGKLGFYFQRLNPENQKGFSGDEAIGNSKGRLYKRVGKHGQQTFFRGGMYATLSIGLMAAKKLNVHDLMVLNHRVKKWVGSYLNVSFKARVESISEKIPHLFPKEKKAICAPQDEPSLRQPSLLDVDFICDPDLFNSFSNGLTKLLNKTQDFDVAHFLKGPKGYSEDHLAAQAITSKNDRILEQMTEKMHEWAQQIAKDRGLSLDKAYKLLVGVLDKFDQMQKPYRESHISPQSTFVLRSALLLASQKDVAGLESWMVYTKAGKPTPNKIWDFLDLKNWVPEAQGAMMKFTETAFTRAIELGRESLKQEAIFLKGGFGAGKTRLAGLLLGQDKQGGVFSPDMAKRVVRRAMGAVPHASAHKQGSQLAFLLFDEMIRQKNLGTIAYDSSLARPSDIENYLAKSRQAGRKMIIHDVARNDMARMLAILKRDVEGDDPRIPPEYSIESAVLDKMNRVKCMEIILNDQTKEEALQPEYHFHGANAEGWDTQELMVLKGHQANFLHSEAKERLRLEGIEWNEETNSFKLVVDEQKVRENFNIQFEKPVKEIMKSLSAEENETFQQVFGNRILHLNSTDKPIENAESLYEALSKEFKSAISLRAFKSAFDSLKPETRTTFFESIRSASSFSYLDLPLRAALKIHQELRHDPWK